MRPLYEIDLDIQKAIEDGIDQETGEILDDKLSDTLDALDKERDDKIEAVGLYRKDILAEAEAVKAEADKLTERRRALEKRAESLANYLQSALNGEKFKTSRLSISYRKSQSTEVTDPELIPMDYLNFPDPVPKKDAIKKAIKAGEEIPGAKLVEKTSIIIK